MEGDECDHGYVRPHVPGRERNKAVCPRCYPSHPSVAARTPHSAVADDGISDSYFQQITRKRERSRRLLKRVNESCQKCVAAIDDARSELSTARCGQLPYLKILRDQLMQLPIGRCGYERTFGI